MLPRHFITLSTKGDICLSRKIFPLLLLVTYVTPNCHFECCRDTILNVSGIFLDVTGNRSETEADIYWTNWIRWTKFWWSLHNILVKFVPPDGQLGHKCDQTYIWGGLVYRFSHFRQVFKEESDSFNHEILVGQLALVHYHLQWLILVSFSEMK